MAVFVLIHEFRKATKSEETWGKVERGLGLQMLEREKWGRLVDATSHNQYWKPFGTNSDMALRAIQYVLRTWSKSTYNVTKITIYSARLTSFLVDKLFFTSKIRGLNSVTGKHHKTDISMNFISWCRSSCVENSKHEVRRDSSQNARLCIGAGSKRWTVSKTKKRRARKTLGIFYWVLMHRKNEWN